LIQRETISVVAEDILPAYKMTAFKAAEEMPLNSSHKD